MLLVEDDPVQQALIERMVSFLPYSLTIAANAKEAYSAFNKIRHEVVLCDINLPGDESGIDILRKLKETPQSPVVVMLTVDSAIKHVILSMRAGAYDYLIKPVQQTELEDVLNRSFDSAHTIAIQRLAERENAEYNEKRLASRQIAEQLVRRQNDKFARALFGNMFTSLSQGRGVGSLTTLVSMLAGLPLSADQKDYLAPKEVIDLILENQDAVNKMVDTFSELHLLVSQELALQDVSLGELHKMMHDLIFEMAPIIALRKHTVILSDLPPRFSGEVLKINWEFMRKALFELIINALKFSKEETPVTILIEYRFTHVLITVLNNPISKVEDKREGIPEEARKLVFEPFFRISRVVREGYRTLEYGLGLTVVDKIIYMHHGKIRATSLHNFAQGDNSVTDLIAFEIELPV